MYNPFGYLFAAQFRLVKRNDEVRNKINKSALLSHSYMDFYHTPKFFNQFFGNRWTKMYLFFKFSAAQFRVIKINEESEDRIK